MVFCSHFLCIVFEYKHLVLVCYVEVSQNPKQPTLFKSTRNRFQGPQVKRTALILSYSVCFFIIYFGTLNTVKYLSLLKSAYFSLMLTKRSEKLLRGFLIWFLSIWVKTADNVNYIARVLNFKDVTSSRQYHIYLTH